MTYKFVLDSYAWIEYVIGSAMGNFVDFILKNTTCFTPSIVLAELSYKFYKEKNPEDWAILFKFIKHNSTILYLDEDLAEKAGQCKNYLRNTQQSEEDPIGLVDAIIYQTALNHECKLITGDDHFMNRKDVVYLKRSGDLAKISTEIKAFTDS